MSEQKEQAIYEGETLDDLDQEWKAEQASQEEEANKPDPDEQNRIRESAEEMNNGFLWLVQNFRCPHVDIDQIVDRERGVKAMMPLAEKFGGEMPEWLKPYKPYIGAGLYMGITIREAGRIEALAVEQMKRSEKEEGAEHGKEPEHVTA